MLFENGTKLLICHRRLFAEDQPRFFVGVVTACEGDLAKVSGFSWTRDPAQGFLRKDDRRTKIASLGSGATIVYELPAEVQVEELRIEQPGARSVRLTDGRKFSMDLAERPRRDA